MTETTEMTEMTDVADATRIAGAVGTAGPDDDGPARDQRPSAASIQLSS
ncbi:hypothetical protein [Achromobacter aloeverae]